MPVLKIRNAADDGWITIGGTPEIVEQASEPGTTYPGQLWHDTDATPPDDTAIHEDVAGEILAITNKVTPVNADVLLIEDTEAANIKKRVTLGNLPYPAQVAPNVDDKGIEVTGGNLNLIDAWAIYQHQRAENVGGGTATNAAWRTVPMTNEVFDGIGCSLSSNDITIPAGTYFVDAFSHCFNTYSFRVRLYNVTDTAAIAGLSTSEHGSNNTNSRSKVQTIFTVAATKVIRLQYYCSVTSGTTGLGYTYDVSDGLNELHAQILLRRIK